MPLTMCSPEWSCIREKRVSQSISPSTVSPTPSGAALQHCGREAADVRIKIIEFFHGNSTSVQDFSIITRTPYEIKVDQSPEHCYNMNVSKTPKI